MRRRTWGWVGALLCGGALACGGDADGGGDDDIVVPPGEVALCATPLPTDGPELPGAGRGAEVWNNAIWTDASNGVPTIPAGFAQPHDEYYRFSWGDIETVEEGAYDWTVFDRELHGAIDEGRTFNFGVMNLFTAIGWTEVDGGALSYPLYLHAQMQADGGDAADWLSAGAWIPNWNHPAYLAAWRNLQAAIADHLATGSYAGVAYRDAVGYIDVRGYGDFGEWHTYPWTGTEPTGRAATTASLIDIIDATVDAFPDHPLVNLMGIFDGGGASQIPPEVTHHALTVTNAVGRLGWRRDNWGDDGYGGVLEANEGTFGGDAFAPLITSAWEQGPIVGEPLNWYEGIARCGSIHCDLERQVRLYHATSFGNGNYPVTGDDASLADAVRAASQASGYRLQVDGGSVSETVAPGAGFAVTLAWRNVGIAPPYLRWQVELELRDASDTVAWRGVSAFTPTQLLPAATATEARDAFELPADVAPGTYTLTVAVRDPAGYRAPLPLANDGVAADGSLALRTIELGATLPEVCP